MLFLSSIDLHHKDMRTTIEIDERLLREAMRCSGKKTKTAGLNEALAEYIRLKRLKDLLGLEGRIRIEDNWRELEAQELAEHSRDGRRLR